MSPSLILTQYKELLKRKYLDLCSKSLKIPKNIVIPRDPVEALALGLQMGRQEGYGAGLMDGTQLGLDVGLNAVDEESNQPVIFGSMLN